MPPGKSITATVTAARQPGFTAEIAVTLTGLLPGAAATAAKVPVGKNEVKVTVNLKPNVKAGQVLVTFQGSAKHRGQDVVARTAGVALVVRK